MWLSSFACTTVYIIDVSGKTYNHIFEVEDRGECGESVTAVGRTEMRIGESDQYQRIW
jgi:hypothetical protein